MKKFYLIGFVIFAAFCSLNSYANDKYGVLAYHSVVDETNKSGKNYYYPQTISTQLLIQHFNWLKENGFNVVSWQQILDAEKRKSALPDNAVLLSFDDGYETMYSVIYPLLKAYNYPAVFAPVTSWIDSSKEIRYGNKKLPRSTMTTWAHINEMVKSGLVEIASHTYNQHYGHNANPYGSSLPAIIAPEYKNGKYETRAQYMQRLERDMTRSAQDIKRATGKAPTLIVWPYGQYNDAAVKAAGKAGMPYHASLKNEKLNTVGTRHVGRLLLEAETPLDEIENYLRGNIKERSALRAMHIKLDDVYSPDPVQFNKNFDAVVSHVYNSGVDLVYLQAYSDENHDGIADTLYFPNSYLPVKVDLFSRVAWQLFNRAEVKVYAEMPVTSFNFPNAANNLEALKSIYSDLSFYAKFNGILFKDPATENYVENLPHLIKMTEELKSAIGPYAMHTNDYLTSAYSLDVPYGDDRNISQYIEKLSPHYGNILLSAIPYAQAVNQPSVSEAKDWFGDLIKKVKNNKQIVQHKILFEFSTINKQTGQPTPEKELISWIKLLEKNKIYSFGYSPDNFTGNQPDLQKMKPYISANGDALKK